MQFTLLVLVSASFVRDARVQGFLARQDMKAAVKKPSQDPREYAYDTLPNGMRVLVVSDPTAAKAGFAVGVDAGSFSDGTEFPGVAHFCEHMLFLGNEKYPDQGDFDNYLSQHDGGSNAYTDQEMTVYFNEVGLTGLEGGLDRFTQFFISPLFNVSMATKEVNAVNQEHEKNKPSAFRRTWEVLRALGSKESVVSRFFTGDKATLLKGDESGKLVVDALKKYHGDNYCPSRETGVIVANLTTAKLLEYAHTFYGTIPEKLNEGCIKRREFNAVDAWEGNLGQMVHMGTHASQATLWVMFSMPRVWEKYGKQPGSYLSFLFSDAREGSIQSALKAKNLATGFSSWLSDTSAGSMFWVMIDLTDDGAREYPKVLELIYGYTALVRKNGVDKDMYQSLADLAQVHFDYQDPPNTVMDQVSSLASGMIDYKVEDVLSGGYLVTDLDTKGLELYLERLKPEFSNAALVTPQFTTNSEEESRLVTGLSGDCAKTVRAETEENYEVDYVVQKMCGKIWEVMEHPFGEGSAFDTPPEVHAPTALMHVPHHFEVTKETSGDVPQRVSSAKAEAWWTGIGAHKLPKADIMLKLSFAKDVADAELAVAGLLHAELVRLALEEQVDELLSCGLSYSVGKEGDGFTLSFSGFDDHMEVLIEQVLAKVRSPGASDFVFERTRQAKMHSFEDVTGNQAYQHGLEYYSVAMDSDAYAREEYLQFLRANTTTAARVQEVVGAALKRSKLTVLLVGNIPLTRAESMVAMMENALLEDSLPDSEAFKALVVHPAQGKGGTQLRVTNPIPGDTNHATINVYQWPRPPTIPERVKLLLLGNMLYRQAFDELRTNRQLGYVVSAGVSPHGPVGELKVLVQGTKATPDEVDGYIEEMLDHFKHDLKNMKDEEFLNWKRGLRTTLAKEDQTMHAEASRFWHAIRDESYCFNKKELSVSALDQIGNVTELVSFFDELRGEDLTKVSVKVYAEAAKANVSQAGGAETVTMFASTGAADLRPKDPQYYENTHLCPDKVLLLQDSAVVQQAQVKAAQARIVRSEHLARTEERRSRDLPARRLVRHD